MLAEFEYNLQEKWFGLQHYKEKPISAKCYHQTQLYHCSLRNVTENSYWLINVPGLCIIKSSCLL